MSKIILFFSLLFTVLGASAQTVTNGNFNSTTTGWGCSPEVNTESVYGGLSATNLVAEVDQSAGLCQTISGFVAGVAYKLTLSVSRRTTCGPTLQTMNATIGSTTTAISRNGTAFAFTTETIVFTATATSQTLNFVATTAGTCNLIVDNIAIVPVSPLPVELIYFSAATNDNTIDLNWSTASENRNDYFTVERSQSGFDWEVLATIAGTEHTTKEVDYAFTDKAPYTGVSYYRLSQTDLDGKHELLGVVSMQKGIPDNQLRAFPNPAVGAVTVSGASGQLRVFTLMGEELTQRIPVTESASGLTLDISALSPGSYLLQTDNGTCRLIKR